MKVAGAYWRGDSQERDAPAHLRHGVGEEGGAGRLPADARGSREARPPQARPRARPVPLPGRGAGHGVLASEGLGDLAAGRAVHAPRLPGQRLPGGARRRRSSTARCGSAPGTGRTTSENMFTTESEKRDLRPEADELPGPRADLQLQPAQLSRAAAALRRVRRLPSQRAVGRAARHHARARLHAGRRPHLLHGRPDPRGVRRLHGARCRRSTATSASSTSCSRSRCAQSNASARIPTGKRPSTR